ncbi:MAG: hypothetical protein OHK0048_07050 [Rhodoferax sp.]
MKQTLLVVDDSKVSRMMIKGHVLKMQPDWSVIEAGTGDEGIALAKTHRPQFITMDVNMPGISGFEAVARIRAFDPYARIVIFTANIQESSRENAAALKVHFVPKPATEANVRQAVDYFLAQP